MAATIYLIPIPIADNALNTLSPDVLSSTKELKHYFVEDIRTARRFLRSIHPNLVIEELQFSEIDKHTGADMSLFRKWLKDGCSIGIISEAGCPGIADPGAELVAVAQSMGAKVVPIVGPNSLMLALMASGLNGQSFCFNGYLPVKEPARSKKIKDLELLSIKEKQTQIFIETPYRNDVLLADLLRNCKDPTRICIAKNITALDEFIKTKTTAEWKKAIPVLGKAPAVFLMLGA